MATLHVRNVPDNIYKTLKARAQAEGRSLSAELVNLLHRALSQPYRSQGELLQAVERQRRFNPAKIGAPSSLELLLSVQTSCGSTADDSATMPI